MSTKVVIKHAKVEPLDGFDGKITAVSYEPNKSMSFTKWMAVGQQLGQVGKSLAWWTGDWLRWGEELHGEKYAQALDATGRDPKTLMAWIRVCKAIDPGRRREELSFSHHESVSALEPDDQSYWLGRAIEGDVLPNHERESWSTQRLRAELRKEKPPPVLQAIEVQVIDKAELLTAILAEQVSAERRDRGPACRPRALRGRHDGVPRAEDRGPGVGAGRGGGARVIAQMGADLIAQMVRIEVVDNGFLLTLEAAGSWVRLVAADKAELLRLVEGIEYQRPYPRLETDAPLNHHSLGAAIPRPLSGGSR